MALDELIRAEVQRFRLPHDPAEEADAIRARVRQRRARRARRWSVGLPVGAAAAVAIGVALAGIGSGDRSSVHLSTVTTSTTVPTTTVLPDPLAATGVCRSLLPTTVDPLDPVPATTVPSPGPTPQGTTSTTAYVDPEPEVDTPCGRALAAFVQERIAPTWRPWDDNPFGESPISEMAPPDSYGTVTVSTTDDSGAILQVRIGYGVPGGDVRSIQGFGRPLDDLPEGWSGTTDFVPGEDRISADVTVVRPGRLPVIVVVKLGNPGMGPPQPEGTVLPMTYAEARALAMAVAEDGPAQSP